MQILLLDNYDSFVYNLAHYCGELEAETMVYRNDALTCSEIHKLSPDGIILSPGPGNPASPKYFGVCREVIEAISPHIPTLGVCLGHQGIGIAFGAELVASERIRHGKASMIHHDGDDLFQGVPSPFRAGRYHSLILELREPHPKLRVTAKTAEGEVMGIAHRNYPIWGLQFHPESILTEHGHRFLENFLTFVKTHASNS